MDPGEILTRGRRAALDGRFEEALQDFVWFHDNALEINRAYYGVRLSFALGYWTELADAYPPARRALLDVKRRGEATLMTGTENRDLFHEVVLINRNIGKVRDTHSLFRRLIKHNPELGRKYIDLAAEAIVEARDYKLAAKYMPHPEQWLLWVSKRLNDNLSEKGVSRKTAELRRKAYVHNYCHDVRIALNILGGLGNDDAASAAREWAIALVDQRFARRMVCAQLLAT